MTKHSITVIGANNVDITATAFTSLIYGDSNPGEVRTGMGGVGRNIAENLARLGQEVRFLTVFGDDEFSRIAKEQANRVGIDVSDSLIAAGKSSSVYVCINDPNGEMSLAVNDMEIMKSLTTEFLATKLDVINSSQAVVIDANLPQEAIDFIVQYSVVPVFADAVSVKKAVRLHQSLPQLTALKANQIEVELLTGIHVGSEDDAVTATQALHQMGVEHVLLTLGKRGAFVSDGKATESARSLVTHPVNTTGCGDAFFAASVCAILEGLTCGEILRYGLAGAAVCAESPLSVSERMSMDALQAYLKQEE